MRTPKVLACVVLALVPAGASARVARSPGRVTYVAAGQAYLDRGRDDGLAVGDELELSRERGAPSRCKVVEVGDHHATCAGEELEVDASFAVPRAPQGAAAPKRHEAREEPSAAQVQAWHETLASTPFGLVEYEGAAVASARVRAGAELGHAVWTRVGADGTFGEERLDAAVGVQDWGLSGLALAAQLTARYWSQRPAEVRFRPDDEAQLYVWEAGLTYRPREGHAVAAVGRLRPWYTPGLALLDGVQLGWRDQASRLELGVFAGGLPSPVTLAPSSERWTAGVYATHDVRLTDGILVRPAARAAILELEDGRWLSAELEGRAQWGSGLRLGATARADVPMDRDQEGARISAMAVDLDARPLERLTLFASARHYDAWHELAELQQGLGPVERGDVGAQLAINDWLALAATGGVIGGGDGPLRGFGNPELRLANVLPWQGTMALGYIAELGYLGAHTAYVQGLGAPIEAWRVWTRLSLSLGAGDLADWGEAAASVGVDARLTAWLRLRLTALGQLGRFGAGGGEPPLGFAGRISLVGG